MGNKIAVILNTHGGKLDSKTKTALVEKGMQEAGLDYQLELTNHADHGIELARQAVLSGCSMVVAAGGDGTINEVINGLMDVAGQDEPVPLGILPLGTANDLADMLKLPRDIRAACQRLAAGNTRIIDLGLVNERYFANNAAVGLEAIVTTNHDKMRQVRGNLRYILAALKTIANAESWVMRLDWGNGMYEGPIALVSVGNSPRTGGSFFMTPQAELDDGLLDFVYAVHMSRVQMLRLLPQTFSGKHIHHPLVTYLQTKSLTITATPGTPIQADGEIIDEAAREINYSVVPQKLHVIV